MSFSEYQRRIEKRKTNTNKKIFKVIKSHDFINILKYKPVILDIRTKDELATGYFKDSLRIPFTNLMSEY